MLKILYKLQSKGNSLLMEILNLIFDMKCVTKEE